MMVAANAAAADGFAPALSVTAREIGSATSTRYKWFSYWGSYDRDSFTQQDVQIEAHNLSQVPGRIRIDFYFVGQPEHQAEPRKLFSRRTF